MNIAVSCADLDAAIAAYEQLGLRLDMIMPADAPRLALMSAPGIELRLELEGARVDDANHAAPAFTITRAKGAWGAGRAGMQYRDLIPGRLGGRVIASHIRIQEGGPVPDYVHYHHVRFQMIYCVKGWVRVVYEDQGPPFVMQAGDCVLQPPGIRHRVLESSAGLEVIEVSAPAEHETFRDHDINLPTTGVRADRKYGAQHFVRHVAAEDQWEHLGEGFEICDTGIGRASGGNGAVNILRARRRDAHTYVQPGGKSVDILIVLDGAVVLHSPEHGRQELEADDACVLPARDVAKVTATGKCQVLQVTLKLSD
jgi:quercetin dioxygenase-like cupin family protein